MTLAAAPQPPALLDSPIVRAYRRKTPASEALAQRAREVFPSGITHDVRYIEPYGIYVTRAQAMRKWDVDGNEHTDYPGGHGALLLRHGHPAIVAALQQQIPKGTPYGACHALELRYGELIQRMVPCALRVRLINSGTEATL